jgi:hypothetical protein
MERPPLSNSPPDYTGKALSAVWFELQFLADSFVDLMELSRSRRQILQLVEHRLKRGEMAGRGGGTGLVQGPVPRREKFVSPLLSQQIGVIGQCRCAIAE